MDDELGLFAAVTAVALVCNTRMKARKDRRRKRSVWVRPLFQRRGEYGATNALLQELTADDAQMYNGPNPYSFNNYTRIDVATYNTLFGMIEPRIRGSSYFRQPVPANEKFAVTLRYLATGKQQSLPCAFQVFFNFRMYVQARSQDCQNEVDRSSTPSPSILFLSLPFLPFPYPLVPFPLLEIGPLKSS